MLDEMVVCHFGNEFNALDLSMLRVDDPPLDFTSKEFISL